MVCVFTPPRQEHPPMILTSHPSRSCEAVVWVAIHLPSRLFLCQRLPGTNVSSFAQEADNSPFLTGCL